MREFIAVVGSLGLIVCCMLGCSNSSDSKQIHLLLDSIVQSPERIYQICIQSPIANDFAQAILKDSLSLSFYMKRIARYNHQYVIEEEFVDPSKEDGHALVRITTTNHEYPIQWAFSKKRGVWMLKSAYGYVDDYIDSSYVNKSSKK